MAWTSPVSWSTIRAALRTWLYGQLGITTIWGRQDAPSPAYPFALLDIIAGPTRVHHDRRVQVDAGDGLVRLYSVGDRVFTLSVEALVSFEGLAWNYDTDANAMMTLAQASLERDAVRSVLKASNVGVQDVMSVQDRRTPLDAGWLSRAGFDVAIHCVSIIDPGSVAAATTVEATGTMTTGQGTATVVIESTNPDDPADSSGT